MTGHESYSEAPRGRKYWVLNVLAQLLKILTATKLDIMLSNRAEDVPTGAR